MEEESHKVQKAGLCSTVESQLLLNTVKFIEDLELQGEGN